MAGAAKMKEVIRWMLEASLFHFPAQFPRLNGASCIECSSMALHKNRCAAP